MVGMIMWKDIAGYGGLYKVSNEGEVKSFQQDKVNGRLLKQHLGTNGYLAVVISKNGRNRKVSVHRLVAEAYVVNEYSKREVNHIDENKLNNNANNLQWVTPKENCNHGTRIKRQVEAHDYEAIGMKNGKAIRQIDLTNGNVVLWDSIKKCQRETGYDSSNIVKCCKGKMKSSYGSKWEYA